MKLYYSPGACSLSPHIAMREAGLHVELVKVDIATKRLPDGRDFREINPNGYVPVLQLDDGQFLTEVPAIVQYIADLSPPARLAPPPGSPERSRLQEWLGYINSELHKAMGPLFDPRLDEAAKQPLRDRVGQRLTVAAQRLEGQTWALGPSFSVADGYLYTVLGWLGMLGMDIGRWPALAAYHARVGARPAVQQALRAEGLLR